MTRSRRGYYETGNKSLLEGVDKHYTGAYLRGLTDHGAAQDAVIFHALCGGLDHRSDCKPDGEIPGGKVKDQKKGGNSLCDHRGYRADRTDRLRDSGLSDRSDPGADA